jgi:hypothetical protein
MNRRHAIRTTRYDNSNNFNSYYYSQFHSSRCYCYFGTYYGLAFFINERKAHYARLDKYVFSPLSTIHEETQGGGNEAYFFNDLSFNISSRTVSFNSIIDSVYYKQALKHMEVHTKDLHTELISFRTGLNQHNKNAYSLRLDIIPALIKREFEKTLPVGYTYTYNYNQLFLRNI